MGHMKWVLARYTKGERYYEYLKNLKLEITWSEKSALEFDSFSEAEDFKRDKLATYDYPFYILSAPTIDPIFL